MAWMLLVLLYGVLKGVREVIKKQAMTKSSVLEVLFLYTLLGFLIVIPDYKNAMGMKPIWYFYVAVKSFIIFLAWILSFKAIKRMPISLYGVLDLSRVLFATLLGTIVLHEILSTYQIFGLISIIEKCKTPIYTIATGAAMSAGFLLLIHGNKRFAYKNASIMVHQVSDGSWGTYEKIKTDLKETKRLHDVIKKMIISKTNIKPEKLDKVFKSQKDWYLDVDQAIKLKIIDAIL